jgi:hypothetical protein
VEAFGIWAQSNYGSDEPGSTMLSTRGMRRIDGLL